MRLWMELQEYMGEPATGVCSSLASVPDPAGTLIIGDNPDVDPSWSVPGAPYPYLINPAEWSSYSYLIAARHIGGGNYVFVDGHAKGISREQRLLILACGPRLKTINQRFNRR